MVNEGATAVDYVCMRPLSICMYRKQKAANILSHRKGVKHNQNIEQTEIPP